MKRKIQNLYSFPNLFSEQKRIFNTILYRINGRIHDSAQADSGFRGCDRNKKESEFQLRPKVYESFLIDGDKGFGKTTLLLTLYNEIRWKYDQRTGGFCFSSNNLSEREEPKTLIPDRVFPIRVIFPDEAENPRRSSIPPINNQFRAENSNQRESSGGQIECELMEMIFAGINEALVRRENELCGSNDSDEIKRLRVLQKQLSDVLMIPWVAFQFRMHSLAGFSMDLDDAIKSKSRNILQALTHREAEWKAFIDKFLKLFDCDHLVFFFDDTDLNKSLGHQLTVLLRNYLCFPEIFAVVASNKVELLRSIEDHLPFPIQPNDFNPKHERHEIFLKIFPTKHTFNITPRWKDYFKVLGDDSSLDQPESLQRLLSLLSEGKLQDSSFDLENRIFLDILVKYIESTPDIFGSIRKFDLFVDACRKPLSDGRSNTGNDFIQEWFDQSYLLELLLRNETRISFANLTKILAKTGIEDDSGMNEVEINWLDFFDEKNRKTKQISGDFYILDPELRGYIMALDCLICEVFLNPETRNFPVGEKVSVEKRLNRLTGYLTKEVPIVEIDNYVKTIGIGYGDIYLMMLNKKLTYFLDKPLDRVTGFAKIFPFVPANCILFSDFVKIFNSEKFLHTESGISELEEIRLGEKLTDFIDDKDFPSEFVCPVFSDLIKFFYKSISTGRPISSQELSSRNAASQDFKAFHVNQDAIQQADCLPVVLTFFSIAPVQLMDNTPNLRDYFLHITGEKTRNINELDLGAAQQEVFAVQGIACYFFQRLLFYIRYQAMRLKHSIFLFENLGDDPAEFLGDDEFSANLIISLFSSKLEEMILKADDLLQKEIERFEAYVPPKGEQTIWNLDIYSAIGRGILFLHALTEVIDNLKLSLRLKIPAKKGKKASSTKPRESVENLCGKIEKMLVCCRENVGEDFFHYAIPSKARFDGLADCIKKRLTSMKKPLDVKTSTEVNEESLEKGPFLNVTYWDAGHSSLLDPFFSYHYLDLFRLEKKPAAR